MPKCRQTFQSTSHGTPPRRLLKIDGTKVTIMNWRKSAICRAWRAAQGGRRPDLFGCIHGKDVVFRFIAVRSGTTKPIRLGGYFRIYVSSFDLAISAIHTIRLYYFVVSRTTRCAETRDIRRDSRYTESHTPDRARTGDRTLSSAVHSHGPTPHATATLVPPLRDRTISRALYLSSLHCRDTVENEMHEKPPGPFSQSDGVHASIRHLLGELKGSSGGAQP